MGKWNQSLKLEIYLVDNQGNKELKEETMTSPEAFFEQFPVHKSLLTVQRQGNTLVITEEDEGRDKKYLALVYDPKQKEGSLEDDKDLKALFVAIRTGN